MLNINKKLTIIACISCLIMPGLASAELVILPPDAKTPRKVTPIPNPGPVQKCLIDAAAECADKSGTVATVPVLSPPNPKLGTSVVCTYVDKDGKLNVTTTFCEGKAVVNPPTTPGQPPVGGTADCLVQGNCPGICFDAAGQPTLVCDPKPIKRKK